MDGILQLPAVWAAALFVAATLALAFGSYYLSRRALCCPGDDTKNDLVGPIFTRVGALHALILALVFAQELINVRDITTAASREAVLVGDTFYDLARYDAETTLPIRRDLARYVRHVIQDEWPQLANADALHSEAWAAWENAYVAILNLEPHGPRQQTLKDLMVHNVREVSGLRRVRENAALAGVQGLFMVAAIAGVVLTSAGLFAHAPTAQNLFLLSIFAAYTGLIVFFVVAFSNPYHPPGMVKPSGFEKLFTGEVALLGS